MLWYALNTNGGLIDLSNVRIIFYGDERRCNILNKVTKDKNPQFLQLYKNRCL